MEKSRGRIFDADFTKALAIVIAVPLGLFLAFAIGYTFNDLLGGMVGLVATVLSVSVFALANRRSSDFGDVDEIRLANDVSPHNSGSQSEEEDKNKNPSPSLF